MGFEAQNRIKLLSGITDVSAFAGWVALRNPIEPMQAHDMVDSKQAGVPHLETDVVYKIAVFALAKLLRIQRAESPVLAFGEIEIRRRSGSSLACENILLAPN